MTLNPSRAGVCLGLLLALITTNARPAAQNYAPLPDRIVGAKTIYLVNDSGNMRVFDKLFKDLRNWGRFTVVTNREGADLVAVLTTRTISLSTTTGSTANPVVVAGSGEVLTDLHLRVFDARTGEQLWTDMEVTRLVDNLKKRMPNKGRLK